MRPAGPIKCDQADETMQAVHTDNVPDIQENQKENYCGDFGLEFGVKKKSVKHEWSLFEVVKPVCGRLFPPGLLASLDRRDAMRRRRSTGGAWAQLRPKKPLFTSFRRCRSLAVRPADCSIHHDCGRNTFRAFSPQKCSHPNSPGKLLVILSSCQASTTREKVPCNNKQARQILSVQVRIGILRGRIQQEQVQSRRIT